MREILMKVSEAIKIIDEGWVRKPKGFRVRFQKMVGSELIADTVPGEGDAPLDSDVAAWRLAWKLSQTTQADVSEISEGDIVNIYVVDDLANPVKFYGTNKLQVLRAVETG
jgi:hypothetical protein